MEKSLHGSVDCIAGILVVLTIAVIPALGDVSFDPQFYLASILWEVAYRTPQLIASATPNFSLRCIWRPQMSFQGIIARAISIMAE